jgi:hypothetical protein
MPVRYNVIKEPKVGEGPTRLLGRFETRAEAEAVAKEAADQHEKDSIWRIFVEAEEYVEE